MKISKIIAIAALSGGLGSAQAALFTNDFGALVPGYTPNDDTSYGAVALPFAFNFFGKSYNSIYINNNGNLTFGGGATAFSSSPLNSQNTRPMIAAFWSDLDSRSDPLGAIAPSTGGSGVYFRQVNEDQVVVTWDRLGFFSNNYSGRVQFQIVLNDPTSALGAQQGEIGLYYGSMLGVAGKSAAAGFGDGLSGVNPGELSLFSGIASTVAASLSNASFRYDLVGGTPTQMVSEPASLALLGLGLAGLGLSRRKRA